MQASMHASTQACAHQHISAFIHKITFLSIHGQRNEMVLKKAYSGENNVFFLTWELLKNYSIIHCFGNIRELEHHFINIMDNYIFKAHL